MRILIKSQDDCITLRTARPDNSFGVYVTGLKGWYGTPQPREEVYERWQTDGDYMPENFSQGSRILTVSGYGRFRSSVSADLFADRLSGLACKKLLFICEDAIGRRECACYLSDDLEPQRHERGLVVIFDLILTCPDAKKYGEPIRFRARSGYCDVVNMGTTSSYPVIITDGSATHLTATLGSQSVSWEGPATPLRLDFKNMQPSVGVVNRDNAFEIPPGKHRLEIVSDGNVLVECRPAWR